MAFDQLVHGERANAIIGWVLTGIVVLGAVESFLTNAALWGVFALLLVAVATLPALTAHDWTAMIPWSLLSVGAIAVLARAAEIYSETAGYIAIATLAFVFVVELDAFTPVELSRRFAVAFAVMTTMALQALWIIAQFYSDQWLGTAFLSTQTELQEDIVIVTIVGFVLGGVFEWYFARGEPAGAVDRASNRGETP